MHKSALSVSSPNGLQQQLPQWQKPWLNFDTRHWCTSAKSASKWGSMLRQSAPCCQQVRRVEVVISVHVMISHLSGFTCTWSAFSAGQVYICRPDVNGELGFTMCFNAGFSKKMIKFFLCRTIVCNPVHATFRLTANKSELELHRWVLIVFPRNDKGCFAGLSGKQESEKEKCGETFIQCGVIGRGTFWNSNVPTAVVAGDSTMSVLSVYQHLSVEEMEILFGIQKEIKGLLIVPISVSVWQTE